MFGLVTADDAAVLGLQWLALMAAIGAYIWATDRPRKRPMATPDRSVHRAGSIADFHARRNAERWP
jgi:hypothetical protein